MGTGALQIGLYSTLLWRLLGPAVGVGVALLALLLPLNTAAYRSLTRLRREALEHTDGRVRLASEIIQGARVIKMQVRRGGGG